LLYHRYFLILAFCRTGTNILITPDWTSITNTPTTIAGYNITDAQLLNDKLTQISNIGSNIGFLKFDNNVLSIDYQGINFTGDVTGTGTTDIVLTLIDSGVTASTYNSSNVLVLIF